jgi:hypothetical protein
MKYLIIIAIFFLSFSSHSIPIPKGNKATFDVIRKNKVIGTIETIFTKKGELLIIDTNVDIDVKIFFFPAYKFTQTTKETWLKDEFIEVEGHTNFEDEREYFITGRDTEKNFIANGMDGELILDKNIMPSNYLNKEILKQKKMFDTQKGIVREIKVTKLDDETIEIDKKKIITEKYLLDASRNPKDKGPFPQYTLWYAKNGELLKFNFTNWKDKKVVTNQRSNWED